ncbi:hypothetical protein KC221_24555, partial [Mycobacterium tuberculosis]|nr:hypothetical protein [Mycobacterium tuberculosis]
MLDHDFAGEMAKLGISAEVANLLMQPTPDDVYKIDSVGRALLTRTSVQSVFSFSVFKTETPSPKPIDVVNLCYNNRLVVT